MPQGIGTYGSQVGRPPKTAAYQKDTDFDFDNISKRFTKNTILYKTIYTTIKKTRE